MAGSMREKLNLVREAEEKAAQTLRVYQRMAEETISQAREEVARMKEREDARAREEGEAEMEEIIRHARTEAEELRVEYMLDRAKLLAVVAKRRKATIAYLLDMLERGI